MERRIGSVVKKAKLVLKKKRKKRSFEGDQMIDYRLRQNRHGNMSLEERFWSKVDKKGEDECWEWKAGKNRDGYGNVEHNGKTNLSHRVSYILTHGSIPEGLYVLHKCNNPSCVNPKHLYLGTPYDNMKYMSECGRSNSDKISGEKHWNSKLNWEVVNKLREEYANNKSVTMQGLTSRYNIPFGTIGSIMNNQHWIDTNYIPVHRRRTSEISKKSKCIRLVVKR